MIRSHNILFGLGKGFCENYNYNHNRNTGAAREFNEFPIMYPGIYNNLMAPPPTAFYNVKEGFIPYSYNYGSFVNNNKFTTFGGSVLQNLVNDLNVQNLNLHQIYNQNSRNGKMNMKKQ